MLPPDLVKPEMHPEQGPVWEWIYEHLDDVYERMHSNYRQPGAGALREVDSESMEKYRDEWLFHALETGKNVFEYPAQSAQMAKNVEMLWRAFEEIRRASCRERV